VHKGAFAVGNRITKNGIQCSHHESVSFL
jgi:hypothetical protein